MVPCVQNIMVSVMPGLCVKFKINGMTIAEIAFSRGRLTWLTWLTMTPILPGLKDKALCQIFLKIYVQDGLE